MTITDAFNEFIITQQLKGNSEQTVYYYKNCLEPLLKFVGANTDIHSFTVEHVKEYCLALRKRDIVSNSFKTYVKGIKAFLSWLYQEEYTAENFSDKIQLPKAERKTIDVLSPREIEQLFRYFDVKKYSGLRNYCICALMLDSGLRRSEVVRLKVTDVHFDKNSYLIVSGKGNKQRMVPLGLRSQKHLMKYIARRPPDVYTDALFLTKSNTPITQTVINRLFKTLKVDKVGGDHLACRIHPHLLRHTFATSFLENGGNIYLLQQILGHTTLDMVKKYVHLTQAKSMDNFRMYSPLDNIR